MQTDFLKTMLAGGKAAALAAVLATGAAAQETVPTPEGNVVLVPEAALEADSPSVLPESGYMTLTSFENDQVVAETLIGQGFTNVVINRTGPIMTVTAERDGVPTELVYSTANGRLMSVDGVPFPHPADAAAATERGSGAAAVADPVATDAAIPDGDAGDAPAGDAGDAAAEALSLIHI